MNEQSRIGETQRIPNITCELDDARLRRVLAEVAASLRVYGYDSLRQIVGYLITSDPTYITDKEGARGKMVGLGDNYRILELVVRSFVESLEPR